MDNPTFASVRHAIITTCQDPKHRPGGISRSSILHELAGILIDRIHREAGVTR